jgi:hypothetical protein
MVSEFRRAVRENDFGSNQDKVVLLGRHHDQVVHDVKGPWTL